MTRSTCKIDDTYEKLSGEFYTIEAPLDTGAGVNLKNFERIPQKNKSCRGTIISKTTSCSKTRASNRRPHHATCAFQSPVYVRLTRHRITTFCRQATRHPLHRPLHLRHHSVRRKIVPRHSPPRAIRTNPIPCHNVNSAQDTQ